MSEGFYSCDCRLQGEGEACNLWAGRGVKWKVIGVESAEL